LKDASCKDSTEEVECLEAICEELEKFKSQLEDEIHFLEKELQKEKSKCSD
jgi:hypothetical protein